MDLSQFSISGYRGDDLDRQIQEILEVDLELEDDGTMAMPLKAHQIGDLWTSIRRLVEEAQGTR
jgi:hypothetical protein